MVLPQVCLHPLLPPSLEGNKWQCLEAFLVVTIFEEEGCYHWHLVGRGQGFN